MAMERMARTMDFQQDPRGGDRRDWVNGEYVGQMPGVGRDGADFQQWWATLTPEQQAEYDKTGTVSVNEDVQMVGPDQMVNSTAPPPMPSQTAPAGSTGSAVPPPPPPPPPANLGPMTNQIGGFLSDWLSNPNRYMSDMAQAQRAESIGRLEEMGTQGTKGIEEWAAGRGLTGSSYEGEQMVDLQESMGRVAAEDEARMLEMLTGAETMDKQLAAQLGLDYLGAADVMGLDRYRALLEGLGLGEAQRQFDTTAGFTQQEIDLKAEEIMKKYAAEGRALDIEEARYMAQMELERERMGQQESQFSRELEERREERLQRYGLDREALDLEAQRIAQEYELQGRSLDITEARNMAEIELRAQALVQEAELAGRAMDIDEARMQVQADLAREEMALQESMFTSELDQREAEFARTHELNEEEFRQRQEEFSQQMAEQIATRLQQDEQFMAQLGQDAEQFFAQLESTEAMHALEIGIQTRALDLQEQGMEFDQAMEEARWGVEKDLMERSMVLQEKGFEADEAYRWAALEQDGEYQKELVRLQEAALMGYMVDPETGEPIDTLDAQYRAAELAYKNRTLDVQMAQFEKELAFRMDQADTDQDRWDAMIDLWEEYFGEEARGGGNEDRRDEDIGGGDGDTPDDGGGTRRREIDTRRRTGTTEDGEGPTGITPQTSAEQDFYQWLMDMYQQSGNTPY